MDIPKWIEKAGHRLVSLETRDGYDETHRREAPVGASCNASSSWAAVSGAPSPPTSWSSKLRTPDRPRETSKSWSSTRPASTSTSRASCTSRWAASAPRTSSGPSASLLDKRVTLIVGKVVRVDEANRHVDARRMACRSATTSSSSRPAHASCPRRSSTSTREAHHFYTAEAAAKLRTALDRFTGGQIVIGIAGHALQVPAGAARGRVPHRGRARDSAACASLRDRISARRSGERSPSRCVSEMATPILEAEVDRAAHVLQRRGHRPRAQGRR